MAYTILTVGGTVLLSLILCSALYIISLALPFYFVALGLLGTLLLGIVCLLYLIRFQVLHNKSKKNVKTIAFLHLNADQFGGGEKVLWQILDVVAGEVKNETKTEIIIYCAPSSKYNDFQSLLENAQKVFAYPFSNLDKNPKIHLCSIPILRTVYNTRSWPMTLLSMAFSAYFGGIACCLKDPPHLVIDTAGYPVAFPAFTFFAKAYVSAYIHYPFAYCLKRQLYKHVAPSSIHVPQAGMPDLHSPQTSTSSENKTEEPSSDSDPFAPPQGLSRKIRFLLRKRYYCAVQEMYYAALRRCSLVWVNSSWTKQRHVEVIEEVETRKGIISQNKNNKNNNENNSKSSSESAISPSVLANSLRVLYPPCDSEQFLTQLSQQWKSRGYYVPTLPSLSSFTSDNTQNNNINNNNSLLLSPSSSFTISTSLSSYLVPPRSPSLLKTNTAPSVSQQMRFVKEKWSPPSTADARNATIVSVGQFRCEREEEGIMCIFIYI